MSDAACCFELALIGRWAWLAVELGCLTVGLICWNGIGNAAWFDEVDLDLSFCFHDDVPHLGVAVCIWMGIPVIIKLTSCLFPIDLPLAW